ncbi:hypothetical protein ZIOFF_074353 (mitochondrion) [Zingiber officinale]|uniref:Uncharacterized protein n=1 Tax=Zingiber officinale TaxID=94328 RepID=A0A8J5E9C2_ZINOF|nr:hypothetical protein ZIOFF_074353 [Zingiber officinale]
MARAPPEGGLLRLPPKLRRKSPKPIPGKSSAKIGLSVQVRVVRIFTDMSISPSLSPRQCPDRYAFRAGRNLPDKEFRYLRTVIVTAAVHRGFGRRLPCHQVTNFLDLPALGRRQPPYMVLRLCGDLCFWYPFVEGRSSFSWEYSMGYFSAVAPGTLSLARGIFSTPSYPEKAGAPCALTHPPWTNLAEEPLGFRGNGFSPMFALLKPTFSLPLRLLPLTRARPPKAERSPTDAFLHPTASADRLAPFIFGARALDHLSPIVSLADLDPCYFEVISSIQSLPRFGTAPAARTETVLYPYPVNCCASTHFGENQLALDPILSLVLTLDKGESRQLPCQNDEVPKEKNPRRKGFGRKPIRERSEEAGPIVKDESRKNLCLLLDDWLDLRIMSAPLPSMKDRERKELEQDWLIERKEQDPKYDLELKKQV